MITPELLSPVGDFECLKAAVQNGADAVYFGASSFSARASATNFDIAELENAINYAKLRNVKTNLTLNTLIQNNELEEAINIAKSAYEFGIDAIIVQDLGLAKFLIDHFPKMPIHASTQMTVHNLEGVKKLEELGFSRVVLARELSISEIENICKNSNVEIEAFIHGALCMSYSGRCLFSSMIGGRSGNRGKCAQPCRLPYELTDGENTIDKGYLLSPRDLCSLEYLPELVHAGVKCFKIEGRMKTPEYVATVTRIYRKYLDMIINNEPYIIDENDKKELMQVFNRGGFSTGHLSNEPNQNLVYSKKSNNMGLYLGKIKKYIASKSYIELDLEEPIAIGDSIMVEKENNKYNVSELLLNNQNVKSASFGTVLIGRLKGKISAGDCVYKVASKELSLSANNSFSKEFKKIQLKADVTVREGLPLSIHIETFEKDNSSPYFNLKLDINSDIIPEKATNMPIDSERIINQLSKTGNTEFEFKEINIDLEGSLHLPSISKLNELRRSALENLEKLAINKFRREPVEANFSLKIPSAKSASTQISLCLNVLSTELDYSKLENVENIYIPFKYFLTDKYKNIISNLNANIYIYMPSIIRENYKKLIVSSLPKILETYTIKGFVISNLADINFIPDSEKYEIIGNYTLNIFNNLTISELSKLNIGKFTLSPELGKIALTENIFPKNCEVIVYGNTPVMTANYCLLGKSNHCYFECKKLCISNTKYYLKDRMNFNFRVIPDNIGTVTTIYNSKTTSISSSDLDFASFRIDILDEDIDAINNVIIAVKTGNRLEGKEYTNGNYNRTI